MPYKPAAKRRYRRKRPTTVVLRKRSKAPLNKKQYSAVTKLVKKQLYKVSENHTVFKKIDESMGVTLASKVLQYVGQGGSDINQIPMPPTGDGMSSRMGNSIQPVMWQFQGHMTIPGSSSNQDNRTCKIRLVAAFYDKDNFVATGLTNNDLFRFGNNTSAKSDDYSDLYKGFNWGLLRPFYDRTFTLQPGLGYTNDAGTSIIYQSAPNAGRDVANVNIKHFFPKGLTLSVDGTTETEYTKNKNIVFLAMTRNVNDAYPSSALNLKIIGTTQFIYKDI